MSYYRYTRRRTYDVFAVGAGGRVGLYVDYLIMALIVANVVAVSLETVDPLYAAYGRAFYGFELLSVTVFAVEYVGRVWAATEHPKYDHPVWGRLRFVTTPYMVIDLLAIVPFFLTAFVDLRFLRAIRLLRFLRLLKLTRYSESLRLFFTAVRLKREQFVITSFVGTILLLTASSLMYFVERSVQPEAFSSIPAAMWWGVVTLTTVGYGDVTPATPLGKLLGAAVAVIGIGIFALPASILASGFIEAAQGETARCPHCGGVLLSEDVEPTTDE